MSQITFTTLLLAIFAFYTFTYALPTNNINLTVTSAPSLNSRYIMAVPRCTPLPTFPKFCFLGSYQNAAQGYATLSVFDHNCKMIGFNGEVPSIGTFGLDSQLPYVCVVTLYSGNTGCPGDNKPDACNIFGYQRATPDLKYAGTDYSTTNCYGASDGNGWGGGTYCMTDFQC
jgi:hypothetical protein